MQADTWQLLRSLKSALRFGDIPQTRIRHTMFTPEERERLRLDLLEYAAFDRRISGAAITGSAAAGLVDRWSDIDLAFGVGNAAELPSVLSDWTAHMCHQHLALDHLDVTSGPWVYRAFLLPSTLQVDLAFVPATEFRALAPTLRLMFGKANESRHVPPPPPGDIIGLGWLYPPMRGVASPGEDYGKRNT